MNKKHELIYEGKAKKVFSHDDIDKVLIEFKDDATAFNALKKAKFKGKGKLNCLISSKIFELLKKNNIPTHYLELIRQLNLPFPSNLAFFKALKAVASSLNSIITLSASS